MKHEVIEKIAALVTAAFGLVAALAPTLGLCSSCYNFSCDCYNMDC
jgi:hypothetical protein